jgi:hypothetical protein
MHPTAVLICNGGWVHPLAQRWRWTRGGAGFEPPRSRTAAGGAGHLPLDLVAFDLELRRAPRALIQAVWAGLDALACVTDDRRSSTCKGAEVESRPC